MGKMLGRCNIVFPTPQRSDLDMKKTAVYPGTFDPIHNGHFDIIQRAAACCDCLIIAVAKDSGKQPLFDLEQRVSLLETVTASLTNVSVMAFEGLLVNFLPSVNSHWVIRGLRSSLDFEVERQLACMHQHLWSDYESFFLMAAAKHQHLSASLIREVARLKGDLESLVPAPVASALVAHFQ